MWFHTIRNCPGSFYDLQLGISHPGYARLEDFMNSSLRMLKHIRSEIITGLLVMLMLASPLADRSPHLGGLVAVLIFVVLLAGANYIASQRLVWFGAVPLGGIWLITRLLEAFGNSHERYSHLSPIAGFALSCAILIALLGKFRTVSTVTGSVISEAFITYLVIAIAFSQLYWILDHFISNAFDQSIPAEHSSALLYFSMITLSGLGYSDLFPLADSVRLVAAFENTVGIFYIAVVVSRLVSSYHARTVIED